MVKNYILSIDREIKEYFDDNILLIEEQLKNDIFKMQLVSSNKHIIPIIKKCIEDFIQTSISLVDYYVEGIYDSGKNVSRKKLRLKKCISQNEKKYSFTLNDECFIANYKSNKLSKLHNELNKAVTDYTIAKIKEKMESKFLTYNKNSNFNYLKQELVDNEIEDIIIIAKESINNIYDEVLDVLAREILILFRRAQVEEFKNLGIEVVTMITEDEALCCPACSAKSGKIVKLSDIITEFGLKGETRHSFCKYSIDPVISYQNQITTLSPFSDVSQHTEYNCYVSDFPVHLNKEIKTHFDFSISSFKFTNVPIEIAYRIEKLIRKFQIYSKQFFRDIEFIFVNNITDEHNWFNSVKLHYKNKGMNEFQATNEALRAQDKLKFKVASFDFDDKYYISVMSFDSQLVEEIITRKIVKDSIIMSDTVKKLYDEKINSKHIGNGVVIYQNPFISYLAQETPEDYLVESIISYVNQPQKLKELDSKIFEYIKANIFNNVQFFK